VARERRSVPAQALCRLFERHTAAPPMACAYLLLACAMGRRRMCRIPPETAMSARYSLPSAPAAMTMIREKLLPCLYIFDCDLISGH
jgi:hypothetical protein